MIKFREHRGGLEEAMKTYREFCSIRDLLKAYPGMNLSFSKSIGPDDRIGWNSVRHVLVTEENGDRYVFGWCDLGEKDE